MRIRRLLWVLPFLYGYAVYNASNGGIYVKGCYVSQANCQADAAFINAAAKAAVPVPSPGASPAAPLISVSPTCSQIENPDCD